MFLARKAMAIEDSRAMLADQRAINRAHHERTARALGDTGTVFGSAAEDEMGGIHVGDIHVTVSRPDEVADAIQAASQVTGAGVAVTPEPPRSVVATQPLKPISAIAKVGLAAAALASGGGLAAAGYGLWSQLRQKGPAAVDTDTSTQYDLQLVPQTPKGE